MAGPDEIQSAGYRLNLQAASKTSLAEYRVAVWKNDAEAPVSRETIRHVETVAQAVVEAGGRADETARPDAFPKDGNEVYLDLLLAITASSQPEDSYAGLQGEVTALDSGDQSENARNLRRQVATYWDYAQANEARVHMRWAWHDFFKKYDVLITPMMTTPAFEHDHGPRDERRLMVDGEVQPYFKQIFWAGIAICSYLPATIIPTGLGKEGLPIGIQIIGPEYGDLKIIGFAKLLEKAGFAFRPPRNN